VSGELSEAELESRLDQLLGTRTRETPGVERIDIAAEPERADARGQLLEADRLVR
jgi:hypothetical protein